MVDGNPSLSLAKMTWLPERLSEQMLQASCLKKMIWCLRAGGDSMLTICLWKFGFAPTSPDPLWHPDGLSLFDASSTQLSDPISAGPDQSIPIKVSRHLGNLLASLGGICNALCQVLYSSS